MPHTRDLVFDRVWVDHLVVGTTRVFWELSPHLQAPGPWTFQLEVAPHGLAAADDWQPVGVPVEDTYWAGDDEPDRAPGVTVDTHYRVRLTDGAAAEYVSEPAGVYGLLDKQAWLQAREIQRQHRLLLRRGSGTAGWYCKRRRQGPRPTLPARAESMRVDPLGVPRSFRDTTGAQGSPFLEGYYPPLPVQVELAAAATGGRVKHDGRGPVDDEAVHGTQVRRMLLLPPPRRDDLLILDGSDRRFAIDRVEVRASRRGVPLLGSLVLRGLPRSDPAYHVEVPATWEAI